MRSLFFGLFALACLVVERVAAQEADFNSSSAETFVVEKLFAIDVPPGYAWAEVQVQQPADGGKSRAFVAARGASRARLAVTVEYRAAKDDADRIATLKDFFNAQVKILQQTGFRDIKGSRPPLTGQIPDKVDYSLNGHDAAGTKVFTKSAVIFSGVIFVVQAIAPSEIEMNRLYQVGDSFRALEAAQATELAEETPSAATPKTDEAKPLKESK